MIKKFILLLLFSPVFAQFDVTLTSTGASHLVAFQTSITGLDVGDQIGVFDANGVVESCIPAEGCYPLEGDTQYGEVLVGAGTWNDEQLDIAAIMSIDLSTFPQGPILNGAIAGNPIVVRVYDSSEDVILDTELIVDTGGVFNELFTTVSGITIDCLYDNDGDGLCDDSDPEPDCATNDTDGCGVCGGDDSSCEVYVELEITTTLDELIEDEEELQEFEEDFESYMETELGLPGGTVEVTNIEFSETREVQVTIEFTVTLTEEELAETDFDPETAEEEIESTVSDVEEEIEEGLPEFVEGCTDNEADNYNSYANVDDGSCEYPTTVSYDITMHYGANLVSFHALPEDTSIENIMASLGEAVTGVIGEGVASTPSPAGWVGSLTQIEPTSGYWIKVDEVINLDLDDAIPSDPNIVYNMHYGANLISFPISGSVGLADGIPDDVEGLFTGIIGEGVASTPSPAGWVGSLNTFEGTKGYWAKVDAVFEFSYDLSNASSDRVSNNEEVESPYEFTQSTQQAFYFIENIDAEINDGDWILAYNDGVLVGARQWDGLYTDIPAMGYDDISTSGYCEAGDTPQFVWIDSDGKNHILTGNIPAWSNNDIYNISLEYLQEPVPSEYGLIQNYPNPFNPSTTISFTVPSEGHVIISVFDINGRLVSTLLDENISSGYHHVTWDGVDANGLNVSAGLYVYTLSSKNISLSGKMMLMK